MSPSAARTRSASARSSVVLRRTNRFDAARGSAPASACSGVAWASLRLGRERRYGRIGDVRFCRTVVQHVPQQRPEALPAMTSRHEDPPPDGPWRTPTDQTSTPESPAIAPSSPKRRDRTGRPRHPAFRSQHELRPEDQTTDESGSADPESRSRGCSQIRRTMRRGLIRGVGRSTKPDADILRCYADDEGENDRSLFTTDTKTRPLKPGMTCQIELRLIHLISHAASMLCRPAIDDETRRESATRCHATYPLYESASRFPAPAIQDGGTTWLGRAKDIAACEAALAYKAHGPSMLCLACDRR